jgi:hypothetical protein
MMLPGVHPTGPYHLPHTHTMNLAAKVDWAFREYQATYGPAPPDMVVLTAALWDLARIRAQEPQLMGCSSGDHRSSQCQLAEHLPHATTHGYIRNLTLLVRHVQRWVPQVRRALQLQCTLWHGRRIQLVALFEDLRISEYIGVRSEQRRRRRHCTCSAR